METNDLLDYLVVDSGAIIRGAGSSFYRRSHRMITTREVLEEIRDSKSRELLETLPYQLEVRSPSDTAMKAVAEFAKLTGDFAALSLTDLKVIALLYTAEVEVNGGSNIRTAPKGKLINRSSQIKKPAPSNAADSENVNTSGKVSDKREEIAAVQVVKLESESATTSKEAKLEGVEEDPRVDLEESHSDSEEEDDSESTSSQLEEDDNNDGKDDDQEEEEEEEAETIGRQLEDVHFNFADEEAFPSLADAMRHPDREPEDDEELWREGRDVREESGEGCCCGQDRVGWVEPEADEVAWSVVGKSVDNLKKKSTPVVTTGPMTAPKQTLPGWGGSWASLAAAKATPRSTTTTATISAPTAATTTGVSIPKAASPFKLETKNTSNQSSTAQPAVDNNVTESSVPSSKAALPGTASTAPPPAMSRILNSSGASSTGTSSRRAATEDDGLGWINAGNIAAARAHGTGLSLSRTQSKPSATVSAGSAAATSEPLLQTACVTTDFSMQNVILQMGLHVMSVDGLAVTRVKQFVLRCIGCYHIHYDMTRLFCARCGGSHLSRVAASVDGKTGELRLHLKKNYHVDLRGTQYSLPKPGQRGKYDGELLLREDQMLTGAWRQKCVKIRRDVRSAFGPDVASDVGVHVNKGEALVVGYGKKNPNAQKGRERRGKKKRS